MVTGRPITVIYEEEQAKRRRIEWLASLPRTLTAEEANAEFEFDTPLEEGWSLKVFPDETVEEGFSYSFLDPEGWEILKDDTLISPEGVSLTRAEWEKRWEMEEAYYRSMVEPYEIGYEALLEREAEEAVMYRGIEEVFGRVFPERDIEGVLTFAEAEPDEFLARLREIGKTPDTEMILRTMIPGITDEEIGEFLPFEYVKENWFKDNVIDPLYVGGVRFAHGIKQTVTSLLPDLLVSAPPVAEEYSGLTKKEAKALYESKVREIREKYPKPPYTKEQMASPWYREYVDAATKAHDDWQSSFTIYHLSEDTLEGIAESARERFLRYANEHKEWFASRPELVAKPEYELNPFEHTELFRDPGFYAYTISSSLAYSLGVMGTTVGVTLATGGNIFVGLTAGMAVAGAAEAPDMTQELLDRGIPFKEATEWGFLFGAVAGGVESISNLPILGLFFKPVKKAMAPFWKTLTKFTASAIVKAITVVTVLPTVEGMEEAITQATRNAILRHYDEFQSLLEGVDEAFIKGVIASLPFTVVGGGASYINFRRALPVNVQGEIDTLVEKFQKAGATLEQAQLMAANEIAKTPEGEAAISKAIEEVKKEVVPVAPEVPKVAPPAVVPEVRNIKIPEAQRLVTDSELKREGYEALGRWENREVAITSAINRGAVAENITTVQIGEVFDLYVKGLPEVPVVPEVLPPVVEVAKPPVTPRVEAIDRRIAEIEKLLATKGRLPKGMGTRGEVSIELARLEAQRELAELGNVEQLQTSIDEIQEELGLRSMPYHGREPNAFPQYTSRQLDEMLKVYQEARDKLLPEEALKPLPSLPEQTAEQLAANLAISGQPTLTPAQITRTLDLFGKYIADPKAESAWELTRELRRETLAGRVENLKARAQELIVSKGMNTEEAMNQAIRETMAGELPVMRTDYLDDLTKEMRDTLFNKVYQTLKDEPFEMMSTATALTNALLGKSIPRKLGVEGKSAYTRLQRVFGDQPQVFKAIDTVAEQGKMLEDIVEGIYHEIGRPPIPVDEKTADYLRAVSKTIKDTNDLAIISEYHKAHPPVAKPDAKFEAPIQRAFGQVPLMKIAEKKMVVRILKELAWSPVDIGNLIRANVASVDMSFWRQARSLTAGHPKAFYHANIEAWQALWSQKHTEANWQRITRNPRFEMYEHIRKKTGADPLRIIEAPKGTAQWRAAEEFGYMTEDRLIPRLTAKIPWIKVSARHFVTGLNTMVWDIWNGCYDATLRRAEKIAIGEITLEEGEVFDIEQEMIGYQKYLADMTQRAGLGPASKLAPALGSMFFAPRSKLGRLLAPRHLVSSNPRVRALAWKDWALWISVTSGILMLGKSLDLWDVDTDPRSGEFMSIRVGNLRIDPWAGNRQFLVLYTRLIRGTGISSVTGKEYEVNPIGALQSFIRTSLAPLASITTDLWVGKNFLGEDVDIADKEQWIKRITPFSIQDVWDAFDEGWKEAAIAVIPAIFGEGVQTYTGDWVENFTKLGLPKYMENAGYGLMEPYYDVQDFWADTASQFVGVDPTTLTEAKGYPDYIRSIAEARIIKEHLGTLPNERLVNLNFDPAEGATFADYYQMWQDRERLVLAGDDAKWTVRELQPDGKYKEVIYKGEEAVEAFDKDERTRNANLGNFSQRQFALLNQYWAIIDKEEQAEFLKEHKDEIGVNPRHDWLMSHPKENAQLAVWGQAKILSLEAYKETQRLLKELDIPENAIAEQTLPPEGSAENYFKYLEQGEELGYNSWEVQLIIAQDDALRTFLDREPIETPVESLELKIKHRDLFEEYDLLETDEDREALKEANPEWVDDMRRIEAYEKRASEDIVGKWVDRGKKIDEFGASSSEAILWLVDNPDVYDWAIENELLEDNREENKAREPILRINVDYAEYDDWYNKGIPIKHADISYPNIDSRNAAIAEERTQYLADNPEYNKVRYRREALGFRDKDYNPMPPEIIELYVQYSLIPDAQGKLNFRHEHLELDAWLVDVKGLKPVGDRWEAPPEEPELANKKYWLELASHYKNLLKNLGIRLDITPEELTNEQMELIKRAIMQLYE